MVSSLQRPPIAVTAIIVAKKHKYEGDTSTVIGFFIIGWAAILWWASTWAQTPERGHQGLKIVIATQGIAALAMFYGVVLDYFRTKYSVEPRATRTPHKKKATGNSPKPPGAADATYPS